MRVSWSQTLVKKRCTFQEHNLGAPGPIKMEYIFVTPSFQMFLFDFFGFFYDALFLITNASEKEMHLSRTKLWRLGPIKMAYSLVTPSCQIILSHFFVWFLQIRVSWSQTLVKKGCTLQEHNLGALGPIKMEYSFVTPSFQIVFSMFSPYFFRCVVFGYKR